LARHNHAKAVYARERIGRVTGCRIVHNAPVFNEFVVRLPIDAREAVERLGEIGIMPGIPLSRYFDGRDRDLLVCATEINPRAAVDRLADALGGLC
ncbi:MAG: glycine dehydrogenase, partial [Acidobacteria bacterium]|nr:glycine dehydrogenase [Acidobacteriota bacterium]